MTKKPNRRKYAPKLRVCISEHGVYNRHRWFYQVDIDGNYKVCERCRICSFRGIR